VILHLVDGTGDEVAKTYKTIRKELKAYGQGLSGKKEILALNKTDAIAPADLAKKKAALEKASGGKVYLLSGVAGRGVLDVLRALMREIAQARLERAERAAEARARTAMPAPLSRLQRQQVNYNAPIVPGARKSLKEDVTAKKLNTFKRGTLKAVTPKNAGANVKGTAKKPANKNKAAAKAAAKKARR
jgi:50S ribosomal subunit-associated GTPase HflX